MDDDALLDVLHAAATAARDVLDGLDDWSETGGRPGEYRSDLAADAAVTAVLDAAGLGWLSEESGRRHADRPLTVVVDPLDGSTNAHRRIPWFATSLCVVDAEGPRVALVVDQARDRRYHAVRGAGAFVDGAAMRPTACEALSEAVVGLSGMPPQPYGWQQFRALGAAALDLCAVAEGVLDGYVDCSVDAHGSWDYLAATLICTEAGVGTADALGRDLVTLDHAARRTPVAAATPALLSELLAARSGRGHS